MFHAIEGAKVQQGSQEWLASRMNGVGGSDAAAALGLSPYKTRIQLWKEKLGYPANEAGDWYKDRGKLMEPLIREYHSKMIGEKVHIPACVLHHPKHSFMFASLDGFTASGRIAQYKTATSGIGWGDIGTDEIPLPYMMQVQHELAVTGAEIADVVVSIASAEPVMYHVEPDKYLREVLINEESAFWHCVASRTEPEATSLDEVIERTKFNRPAINATAEMIENHGKLLSIRSAIKSAVEYQDKVKSDLLNVMISSGVRQIKNGDDVLFSLVVQDRNGKKNAYVKVKETANV